MSEEDLYLTDRLWTDKNRKDDVDIISKLNGYGSLSTSQTDNMRGINVNRNGSPVPKNKDAHGYTFFTRPDLNLSDDNLSTDRMLTPLLSRDSRSMARALRTMLDPRSERVDGAKIISEICSPKQAFLSILTNNLINISGWPDLTVDTYTSKEGIYKESYSMVDSTSQIFSTFDVTANFRNIDGDPITLLFAVWNRYSSLVYEGVMVPYPDLILENEIDYMTRIYRLVTDETYTYVRKIGASGVSFPLASPIGAAFNYSNDEKYNQDNDQISIPLRCIGANYLDPILVREFNQTVTSKNKSMSDGNRSALMRKISPRVKYGEYGNIGNVLRNYLSHDLYPRIDPYTMELEWYAEVEEYNRAIKELVLGGII